MPWRRDAWQVRASCADVGEERFLQRDRLLDERSRAVPELGVRVPAEGGEVDRVVGAGGRVVDGVVGKGVGLPCGVSPLRFTPSFDELFVVYLEILKGSKCILVARKPPQAARQPYYVCRACQNSFQAISV